MTTIDVLRKARELVAAGWGQGQYVQYVGKIRCVCASGAIQEAKGGTRFGAPYKALAAVVGDTDVSRWNDKEGRTQNEVLAAFDRAIAAEEAKAVQS